MSRSLFDGLSLARSAGRIDIRYPRALRELADAQNVARVHGLEIIEDAPATWQLAAAAGEPYPASLKAFFAQLNDLRAPLQGAALPPPTGRPLVSCIVVVDRKSTRLNSSHGYIS